jgi:sulfite reductase beta subunit-like hemoprotein
MGEAIAIDRARASFADERDIDEFVEMLQKFESGEISSETWRKFRLVRGTYGQRQPGVAERHSRGFAHVTTRQNVQFHFVQLAEVEAAMRHLAEEGLTTREACGNSVRNITACPFSGVSETEVFDVTPYAEALTRYLLRHPLSSILPRKFKIGFEGCSEDHAFASINDLGWTARIQDVRGIATRGFRLTAGGGTSILPRSGGVLFDFLPATEMFNVAEAVIRVFHRLGDYEHKAHNRMKFLIKTLGWDRWRSEVLDALEDVRREGGATLPFDPEDAPIEDAPDWRRAAPPSLASIASVVNETNLSGPGIRPEVLTMPDNPAAFSRWMATNVRRQRQAGYVVAIVRLVLGDITAGQLRVVGELARAFGDGTVRLTVDQNVFLRWVPESSVPSLFSRLAAAGLASPDAATVADVTSCPGAESCRLAVTQSRGLGRVLADAITARPEIARDAASATIKISGCPNGCGQHHIATIGFQGSVRKVDGRAVPQYFVMVGGRTQSDGATFARIAAKVPARRIATALERLLDWYRTDRQDGESPDAFFARVSVADVKKVIGDLEAFDASKAPAEDYVDLGETQTFTPEILEGECAT